MLSSKEIQAEETVCAKEMADIQKVFNKFYSDCVVTNDQLQDIGEYGLWPLLTNIHPAGDTTKDYETYNYEKGKGWRGPYAKQEGDPVEITISEVIPQKELSGGIKVPVLRDPYGGYYRAVIPVDKSSKKITLICTGKNGDLETDANDKDVTYGNIIAQGDDVVLQLLLCAP
jgi:hypothetical protein